MPYELYLQETKYSDLSTIGAPFNGINLVELIEKNTPLRIFKSSEKSFKQHKYMTRTGRIAAGQPMELSVPPNVWFHLFTTGIAFLDSVLLPLLSYVTEESETLCYILAPTGFTVNVINRAAAATTLNLSLDSLKGSTSVLIELIADDTAETVEDSDTGTTDADGNIDLSVTIPTGYSGSTITLRVTQTLATTGTYTFLPANVVHTEDHVIEIL